jgi:hypothetical protein
MPSTGAPASMAVSRSALPAFAGTGPLPTTMLRSPPPGSTTDGRRSQAHIRAQPGLTGPRIVAPSIMQPRFPRLMSPGTAAPSTAWVPRSRAPVEGVSRR